MKLVWTERAELRLVEIHDLIAKDSAERALGIIKTLIDGAEQLARYPLSGPVLPEDGAYRQLVIDGYRVVYLVRDEIVAIMTIVSPGMLAENAL